MIAYAAPLDTPDKNFKLLGILLVIRLNTMLSTNPNNSSHVLKEYKHSIM